MSWRRGDVVVRREVWRGRPWCAIPVIVVSDTDDLLVTYIPEQAPLAFPESADGRRHPWSGKRRWHGHGALMLQRPGEAYAVWHFWHGAARRFPGWYLNLQEPFRRTEIGYDTQDLELDVWLSLDGSWHFKDEDALAERVRDGRFTAEQGAEIRMLGREIGEMLDRGERWWDSRWTDFAPDPAWSAPSFPAGWEHAPVAPPPRGRVYRTFPA